MLSPSNHFKFVPKDFVLLERLSIAFTENGEREIQVDKFSKWEGADKDSLKQFLWIELKWIYRFSCSYNEQ